MHNLIVLRMSFGWWWLTNFSAA